MTAQSSYIYHNTKSITNNHIFDIGSSLRKTGVESCPNCFVVVSVCFVSVWFWWGCFLSFAEWYYAPKVTQQHCSEVQTRYPIIIESYDKGYNWQFNETTPGLKVNSMLYKLSFCMYDTGDFITILFRFGPQWPGRSCYRASEKKSMVDNRNSYTSSLSQQC